MDVAGALEGLGGRDVGPAEEAGPRLVRDGDAVAAGDKVQQLRAEDDVRHGSKGLDDGVQETGGRFQGGIVGEIAASGDLDAVFFGGGDDDAVVALQDQLLDGVD